MTPQIVRSPFGTNLSSSQLNASSPPFRTRSSESCSPSYDESNEVLNSSYYDSYNCDYNGTGGSGATGDYFSYTTNSNTTNLNGSTTDTSNADSITDIIASLALNTQGLTNLQNLASVNALSSTNNGSGSNYNGNYQHQNQQLHQSAQNLDPYSLFAQQYATYVYLQNERKNRELQQQLTQMVVAALMNNVDQQQQTNYNGGGGGGNSLSNSPLTSPRNNGTTNNQSGSPTGSYRNGSSNNNGPSFDKFGSGQSTLDIAARHHRSSANSQTPQKVWEGAIPLRTNFDNEILSNKVFLGGVPWDTPAHFLTMVFSIFGTVRVDWPQATPDSPTGPKGFAYLVFESSSSVKAVLENCAFDGNSYFFKIPSKRRGRDQYVRNFKDVEVVPWAIVDSNCSVNAQSTKLEPCKTIFVGALHGRMTAQALYNVMNDLFGDVVYAGIDTDKHKYPIGSGRVTFSSTKAYSDAIRTAFIEVKSGRICKKLQMDPYLEDNVCSECQTHAGPYFCRESVCYRYFCRSCWLKIHIADFAPHEPIVRNVRKSSPSSPSSKQLSLPVGVTNATALNSFNTLFSRGAII